MNQTNSNQFNSGIEKRLNGNGVKKKKPRLEKDREKQRNKKYEILMTKREKKRKRKPERNPKKMKKIERQGGQHLLRRGKEGIRP